MTIKNFIQIPPHTKHLFVLIEFTKANKKYVIYINIMIFLKEEKSALTIAEHLRRDPEILESFKPR